MTTCNFSFTVTEDPGTLYQRAKKEAQKHNATLNGDVNSGAFQVNSFAVTLKGTYFLKGNMLEITLTSKPFFIQCKTIEQVILGYLG